MAIFLLPEEINLNIFRRLSERDLGCVMCTCQAGKRIAGDNRLWHPLVEGSYAIVNEYCPAIDYRQILRQVMANKNSIPKTNWPDRLVTLLDNNPLLFSRLPWIEKIIDDRQHVKEVIHADWVSQEERTSVGGNGLVKGTSAVERSGLFKLSIVTSLGAKVHLIRLNVKGLIPDSKPPQYAVKTYTVKMVGSETITCLWQFNPQNGSSDSFFNNFSTAWNTEEAITTTVSQLLYGTHPQMTLAPCLLKPIDQVETNLLDNNQN